MTPVPLISHLLLERGQENQHTLAASTFLGKKAEIGKNPDLQSPWLTLMSKTTNLGTSS